MHILSQGNWKGGFLDYHKSDKEYRLRVRAWATLEPIEEAYHVRPKSLRLLWNYFPLVGPGGMFRKTWSRLREERRNEKYVSCGVGVVIETAQNGSFKKGDVVGFMAPFHPKAVERITAPEELIFNINDVELPELSDDEILHASRVQKTSNKNVWWEDIKGWSIYSGFSVTEEMQARFSEGTRSEMASINWEEAQRLAVDPAEEPEETKGSLAGRGVRGAGRKTKEACLFGFGNYAKINNIPYSKPYIKVKTVHEIDPTEIAWEGDVERWDTSPTHRKDEDHDVYFIASYNHTHTPLAVEALGKGADVVMEKPIATSYEQLEQLERAIKNNPGEIFIGFQKRYSKFNDYAMEDLGVELGEPIDYHCVVFEIIQPEYFWYNWPNSRSRLFSNGCHLVDHFLYLNNWSKPKDIHLVAPDDGTVDVAIELENGAFFTMAFSEKGSSRVGPRDHIELKTPGHNVRITDATRYFAENEERVLRRRRVWKTESYKKMYKTIAKKIAGGEKGDSLHSVMVSGKIMLDIEELLLKELERRGKSLF